MDVYLPSHQTENHCKNHSNRWEILSTKLSLLQLLLLMKLRYLPLLPRILSEDAVRSFISQYKMVEETLYICVYMFEGITTILVLFDMPISAR